jgi:crotonobetainyl-CoA:carnitine CoA-transferase CaiB-like acyl-CoA transferase
MSVLRSLKVLDFSTLLPGPYATMMLADLGADVLCVEAETAGLALHTAKRQYLWRSKRSITLDLKNPECIALIKRLVAEYDILVEQFRPGVMARLGLDYETLRAINSSIIYCSISGYGQTGPYKDRAGHDINYLAIAGVSGYSGTPDTGPVLAGIQIADLAGGSLHAVIGILTAVIHRLQTGEGQHVDISMTDASFAMNSIHAAAYLNGGAEPRPSAMRLNGGGYYGYYQTKDGRYISVGSLEPKFFERLCKALGRTDLIAEGGDADSEASDLKRIFAAEFNKKTYREWCDIFAAVDACVEPVLSFSEAVEHPQFEARDMITDVPIAAGGTQRQLAFPIKFSATAPRYLHAGPATGEHTTSILAALGLSSEEIRRVQKR